MVQPEQPVWQLELPEQPVWQLELPEQGRQGLA
jgi:hypothetical protein